MIRDSIFTYFDGGRYSAGLIYIDDLVDGLVLCGAKDQAAGQTYFFGSDWEVSWKQYLDDLAVLFGKKNTVQPAFQVCVGAWICF